MRQEMRHPAATPALARTWLATALAATLAAAALPAHAADAAASAPAGEKPAEAQKPVTQALVETFNKLSGGPHAGFRANHAKGVLVEGSFEPAPTAKSLSKAPHFAAGVPVLVRFSNPSGNPQLADIAPEASPHGMAIRFQLPGGASTDIVAISANSFPVATPEEFLAMLQAVAASGKDAPKPTPIEQFLSTHPAAVRFVTTRRPVPESFGTLAFYGVNSFKFTNDKGETRHARYEIIPVAGERPLAEGELAKAGPDYLMTELPRRIAQAPVKFRLRAQIAKPGDAVDDPTVVWPADRERVELGTISLTATAQEQVKSQRALLFNPVSLPAGIEPSADRILLARFPAYAISFGQRAQ